MAKASLTLPNGTIVQIEGTTEEIQQLLELYSDDGSEKSQQKSNRKKNTPQTKNKVEKNIQSLDYAEIVNLVKDCDEAEEIESQILDRSSQVNRTLLPLYIVYEYLENYSGLTSGEISKVTTDLGIPISQPNASRTLAGTASRYVIGNKVKKRGQAVKYTLSRRGAKYLKAVLKGKESGE